MGENRKIVMEYLGNKNQKKNNCMDASSDKQGQLHKRYCYKEESSS